MLQYGKKMFEKAVKDDAIHNKLKLSTPGERLKYIRELLRVTRAYINEHYGLSADTLTAWENGKSKLTEKGLTRCMEIYRQEGVVLSRSWILTGDGLDPKLSVTLGKYFNSSVPTESAETVDDHELMYREAEYFKNSAPNSVIMIVSSSDMLPLYSPGDFVGGRFRFNEDIAECVGKDCIIQTVNGERYFRRLALGNSPKKYNLVCLNPAWGGNPEPVLFDFDIQSVAPVIWHRRADKD
jgi:transcriptional regulator with XRE-family HTH domain